MLLFVRVTRTNKKEVFKHVRLDKLPLDIPEFLTFLTKYSDITNIHQKKKLHYIGFLTALFVFKECCSFSLYGALYRFCKCPKKFDVIVELKLLN